MRIAVLLLDVVAFCAGAIILGMGGVLAFAFHDLRGGLFILLFGLLIILPSSFYARYRVLGALAVVLPSAIFVCALIFTGRATEFAMWTVQAPGLLSRPAAIILRLVHRRKQAATMT